MKKAGSTYWTRSRSAKSGKKPRVVASTPQWFGFAVVVSITFMLCLAINLRAYSEMKAEASQFEELNSGVEKLTGENLSLQEEIHSLKSDSEAIEREARKIGMVKPNAK